MIMKSYFNRLARQVGEQLSLSNQKLVTAESCTGGWVAQTITAIAGSSAWFERGYITYSNAAKQELLGVKTVTLDNWGAVSEETALEMALGALEKSHAQIALSITGIAGPGGAEQKPVGTVCFAWAGLALPSQTVTQYFSGNREAVRKKSVIYSLEGLINYVKLL